MTEITRYPLCWPDNVARTAPGARKRPLFDNKSIYWTITEVKAEINRLNERRWDYHDERVIVSTNIRDLKRDGTPYASFTEPADTGVAVYFQLRFTCGGKWHERPVVLTCDRWTRVAWNLYAIVKDIEAQRGRNRWGCTNLEQAFRGYLAIPERTGGLAWWDVLGVKSDADRRAIKNAYRERAQTEHPDKGGSEDRWARVQLAYEQAMEAVK